MRILFTVAISAQNQEVTNNNVLWVRLRRILFTKTANEPRMKAWFDVSRHGGWGANITGGRRVEGVEERRVEEERWWSHPLALLTMCNRSTEMRAYTEVDPHLSLMKEFPSQDQGQKGNIRVNFLLVGERALL